MIGIFRQLWYQLHRLPSPPHFWKKQRCNVSDYIYATTWFHHAFLSRCPFFSPKITSTILRIHCITTSTEINIKYGFNTTPLFLQPNYLTRCAFKKVHVFSTKSKKLNLVFIIDETQHGKEFGTLSFSNPVNTIICEA